MAPILREQPPMTTNQAQPGQPGRRAVWTAGLAVAAGAGVATAHGLYQVAAAARVPTSIAWLYPLITDGLALVAYAATSRLSDRARRYAAGIVVLAAGLSGLAQAVYLAGGIGQTTTAPVGLRFGVGAWPAIAAALTAHLLHLIGTGPEAPDDIADALTPTRQLPTPAPAPDAALNAASVQPYNAPTVQPYNPTPAPAFNGPAVQAPRTTTDPDKAVVQPPRSTAPAPAPSVEESSGRSGSAGGAAPARERARQAARSHYARHGCLPTATELMALAQVARGTAGTVLKDLRDNRPALHLVNATTDEDTDQ
jgi:hypothetical protein